MHYRREIDHILDEINEIIAKNKESNKESSEDKAMLKHLYESINLKTLNGERAKGIWTDSPEFTCKDIFSN
jgi:hypothetical protein|tara:strand:+ start:769 stop:981 length:213 start_codon:yes stop_codon:yes gene_type:complete